MYWWQWLILTCIVLLLIFVVFINPKTRLNKLFVEQIKVFISMKKIHLARKFLA